MLSTERFLPSGRVAQIRLTERADGDFAIDGDRVELERRRHSIAPYPWTWLRQVHGASVVRVDAPGAGAGREADAALTTIAGAVVAVQTADCVPVVLLGVDAVAVVHAGWKGAEAGVIEAAVEAMRETSATSQDPIDAIVGPCIGATGYAFGGADLERLCERFDPRVASRTVDGQPALDMRAVVDVALASAEVRGVEHLAGDTADERFFSHRTRVDTGRQSTVAWIEPKGSDRG